MAYAVTHPGSIPDPLLNKRLSDYPTLSLQPPEVLATFPHRVSSSRSPQASAHLPPILGRPPFTRSRSPGTTATSRRRRPFPTASSPTPQLTLTDEAKAALRKLDAATANRVTGDLFALPREARMHPLLRLPVAERMAFTGNLNTIQPAERSPLLAEFNPRERELFLSMASAPGVSSEIVRELSEAKVLRSLLSERQLLEVITDFWFNHFNIFIGKDSDQWYTASYERDAIRKHALGHFRDLLLATASRPP